jgi:hypothetical protein
MVAQMASRLRELFEERTDGGLRSIVTYDFEGVEVLYLRDDVASQYTETEIASAIDESRMQSMSVSIYEGVFSRNHGEIECMVTYFENVVELNFALDDGVGAAVALDTEAMGEARGLVSEAREIVVDERS